MSLASSHESEAQLFTFSFPCLYSYNCIPNKYLCDNSLITHLHWWTILPTNQCTASCSMKVRQWLEILIKKEVTVPAIHVHLSSKEDSNTVIAFLVIVLANMGANNIPGQGIQQKASPNNILPLQLWSHCCQVGTNGIRRVSGPGGKDRTMGAFPAEMDMPCRGALSWSWIKSTQLLISLGKINSSMDNV